VIASPQGLTNRRCGTALSICVPTGDSNRTTSEPSCPIALPPGSTEDSKRTTSQPSCVKTLRCLTH
jgi:hypothetical protein